MINQLLIERVGKIKATKSAAFVGARGFVARLRDCDPNVKL